MSEIEKYSFIFNQIKKNKSEIERLLKKYPNSYIEYNVVNPKPVGRTIYNMVLFEITTRSKK